MLVSVVCPTFNRRAWLPFVLQQFIRFDWPVKEKELLVLDDSPTSNADLFEGFEAWNVRYEHLPERVPLGRKRAMINERARGDIIVCMDDDDVHHPQRIRHSVSMLVGNGVEIVAATRLFVYFKSSKQVRLFGPYADRHGTHGTMAYTKRYAMTHSYEPNATHAEERVFTADFSENMAQLDPRLTILCISHESNTFDKNNPAVLENSQITSLTLRDFW